MTISKIQGDTCEVVALDISQNMSDMRLNYYVAMSRVTKK
jgi:ubiquinone/menaquinone biosynthesis C-methylase UbiE